MPKPYQILMVTDPQPSGEGTTDLLPPNESFRYVVLAEESGTQILSLCQSQQIDGILVELSSAISDRLNSLGQLKQKLGNDCPPIVVIGSDEAEVAVQSFKHGATDYLVRERMTVDDVQLTMRSAIENAQLRRDLQHSQEQFQTSVENMLDCFGIFSSMRDDSGRIVDFRIDYLNRAACENNRMPKEAQIGRGLCELLPGHHESGLFDEYCQVVETGVPLIKDSLVYADVYGQQQLVRAFDIRATKLNDGFVASWRDITDRKGLEVELSETATHLRQHQQQLQRLIDTAPIGIGIGSSTGEVKVINDTMLALHGYTRQEFEQQGMNWRDFTPPEYADRIGPAMTQLRQNGFLPPEEKELVRRDGSRVPIWISATHWTDGADEHVAFAVDLSQQKQAEVTIRANQQRYQELAEAMPVMVWTADATGAVNYWNQRWFEYTRLSEAESLGLAGLSAVHPADRDRTLTQWSQSLDHAEPFEIEYRIRRWDGIYHWFICRGVPTRNPLGQITGWLGTITDINDQKQLEEHLQLVLRAVDGLIFDWNLETNTVVRSEKLRDIVGLTPEEVPPTADWWRERVHPEDRLRFQERLPEILAGSGDLYEGEYRVWHEAGYWVDVWERGCLVRDEQGQISRIVGSTVDISDRKQAELALRESEARFQQLVTHLPQVFWLSEPLQQRLIYVSPAFETVWGLSLTTVYTNYNAWMEAIHPDDRDQVVAQVNDSALHNLYNIEYRIIRPDGTIRWIHDRAIPISQGQVYRVAGIAEDITERKQAELEREELLEREQVARAEAERANRVKDEFLAVLSHELRSPLNPILGWTKLMQSRRFDPAKTAEALATIERNAKLQTQLIDDLLDIARILRGKLSMEVAPVNLVFVIEAAIDTVRAAAVAKNIVIQAELPQIGHVSGDAARLQQIVWNLLANAVKFTPEGGQVEVRLEQVEIPPSPSHPYAQITITDTGKGIGADFLPYIFESFRQEDASTTRRFGGLGLGLAIVRQLVEAHGGAIAAFSPGEGLGATFTVQLPLLKVTTEVAASETPLAQPFNLAGVRVLLVDDEPDARQLLTVLLTQYGAEVAAASTATEALAILVAVQPDLLISDIGMPDVDGYSLIQQIRALPVNRGGTLPAIALTAYAREEDRQRALTSGYQQHATKPIDPDQLVQMVITLLQESAEG